MFMFGKNLYTNTFHNVSTRKSTTSLSILNSPYQYWLINLFVFSVSLVNIFVKRSYRTQLFPLHMMDERSSDINYNELDEMIVTVFFRFISK